MSTTPCKFGKKAINNIAHAMPLDVMSVGLTPDEARQALDEAVQLFLITAVDMGTLDDLLQEAGYELQEGN
jgi:predicted RNase H-like HicB family nuclease